MDDKVSHASLVCLLKNLQFSNLNLSGTSKTFSGPPVSALDNNPIFDEASAAILLGVSKGLLQSEHRPDQYSVWPQGPVRYALDDLPAFRLTHTIRTKQSNSANRRRKPRRSVL
jgi:hypothetical protein